MGHTKKENRTKILCEQRLSWSSRWSASGQEEVAPGSSREKVGAGDGGAGN